MEIITAFGFACIATMAFAVLFQAPKKIVLIDGVIGAIGWVVFIYLRHELGYTSFVSNFCATISLALASELSSRIFKQPVTVFVIPGIVPLVPGLGIYQGMFAIINNEYNNGTSILLLVPGLGIYQGMFAIINNEYNNGTSILLTAMTDSVAIAIGVMLVSSLFRVLKVRRFMLQYRRSKRQMELKVKGRK